MKKKILIGSIFVTLLLLSMPLVSTVQVQSTIASEDSQSSTIVDISLEIEEAQVIANTLLQDFSEEAGVITIYGEVTAVLGMYGDNDFCLALAATIILVVFAMAVAHSEGAWILYYALCALYVVLIIIYESACDSGDVDSPCSVCNQYNEVWSNEPIDVPVGE